MSTPQVGALGERKLSTIHAVAQALAIGPMFSIALVEGSISRPDIGAGWNATLAVLFASLGCWRSATWSRSSPRYAGRRGI